MTTNRFSVPLFWYCFPSLALNIQRVFFLWHPPPSDFFHCSIWESSEICAYAVFSCLFFGCLFVKCFLFFVFHVVFNWANGTKSRKASQFWNCSLNVKLTNAILICSSSVTSRNTTTVTSFPASRNVCTAWLWDDSDMSTSLTWVMKII